VEGAAIVLIPSLPLIGILFVTQVVNAVLLLPVLLAMVLLGRDPNVLGRFRNRRGGTTLACAASALVAVSLVALALSAAG
jgi:Mn2+/Fe2+ NRAMP family transporter